MAATIDILGLGCTSVDDVLFVDVVADADGKQPVIRRERHFGGLTATALVAAARLGARCAYAGILGDDPLSAAVIENLAREGVAVTSVPRVVGGAPVYATIVVAARPPSRTIYYSIPAQLGAHASLPEESSIAGARVLHLDHFGVAGGVRAAAICRRAGGAVVGDLEDDSAPDFSDLLGAIDHLVLSRVMAARLSGHDDPAKAARWFWREDRSAVVVTDGSAGAWAIGADNPTQVRHQPAFPVTVVDTTGCGDVFHGAYAAGLAAGMPLVARLRQAAAAAAIKAASRGGQAGAPDRATVDRFLARNP